MVVLRESLVYFKILDWLIIKKISPIKIFWELFVKLARKYAHRRPVTSTDWVGQVIFKTKK